MKFQGIPLVSCFVIVMVVLLLISPVRPAPIEGDRCANARTVYDRGVKLMNYEERRAAFQKAVDLCPSYAEAHVNLADALENLGRCTDRFSEECITKQSKYLDMAFGHYKKATELDQGMVPAYLSLADIYCSQGQHELAKEACQKALKLRPHDEEAKAILAQVEKRLDEGKGGLKAADKIIQQVQHAKKSSFPRVMAIADYTVADRQSFNNILFEGHRATILPGEPQQQLTEIAKALQSDQLGSCKIVIEGHTNIVPTPQGNMRLSAERAVAVKDYLVAKGVNPERLVTQHFGDTRLKYTDNPKDERNRRVEILFLDQASRGER